jgi:tetratricopeptide (TPR) repeat protein
MRGGGANGDRTMDERRNGIMSTPVIVRAAAFFLACAAASTAGCKDRASSTEPTAAPVAVSDATSEHAQAERLCLADPGGKLPLDDEIRKLSEMARKLPNKLDSWVILGRAWLRKARNSSDPGYYTNVTKCADMALSVEPGSGVALQLRALAHLNDHSFAEARDVAEQILAKDPDDAIALGIQSDALLELGRIEEATAAGQRLMDVKPGPGAYARASWIRFLRGDAPGAKQLIKEALLGVRDARDPEPAALTFVQAGQLYFSEADYDGADAIFEEALRWVQSYPTALVGRARVALARGDAKRAIEHLGLAQTISPSVEGAWLLGDAKEMLGDGEGAKAAFAQVVDLGRKMDKLTLALFYATKDRDHDEALRLIEAERKHRGGVYIDDAYAWVLFRKGRLPEAKRASDEALRLGTKDARLLYHAGAIRLAMGDASGRGLIEQALKLCPGFDRTGTTEAKKLLSGALSESNHIE